MTSSPRREPDAALSLVPLVTGLRDALSIYIQRLGSDRGVSARIARRSHWGLFNDAGRRLLDAWRQQEALVQDKQARAAFIDAHIGEVLDRLERLPESSAEEWDTAVNELALRLEVFDGELRRLVHSVPSDRPPVRRRPLAPGAWSSEDWTATIGDASSTLESLTATADAHKQANLVGAGLAKVRYLIGRLGEPTVLPPLTPTEEVGLAGLAGGVKEDLIKAEKALDDARSIAGNHLNFRIKEASTKIRAALIEIVSLVAGAAAGAPSAASVPSSGGAGADDADLRFMRLAVDEARKSKSEPGKISPMVGVVIVKDGIVVAQAHRGEAKLGEHAEYTALERKVREDAIAGATVYATLEPCTTRNPPKIPCADRLIDRKVAKVWIGTLDPDKRIRGEGVIRLRAARIPVQFFEHSVVEELEELNRHFYRDRRGEDRGSGTPGSSVVAEPASAPTESQPQSQAELDEAVFDALPWAPAGVAGINPPIVSQELGIKPSVLVASLKRLQAAGRLVIRAEASSGIVVALPRVQGAAPPSVPLALASPRTEAKIEPIRESLALLWRVAAPLARASEEVESISVAVVDAPSHRDSKYGWKNEVYVQIKLKEKPTHIPAEWRAAGHTLHYALGAGNVAGVVAMKGISKRMLGLPVEPSGEDGFLTILDLHFLARDL